MRFEVESGMYRRFEATASGLDPGVGSHWLRESFWSKCGNHGIAS